MVNKSILFSLLLYCIAFKTIVTKRTPKESQVLIDDTPSRRALTRSANQVNSDSKQFEKESEIPSKDAVKEESSDGSRLCESMAKQEYEKCKLQYKEITKGEQNSRKICCALKTLQQCVLPVINKYCSFEALNEIDRELMGANHICRIVGSRYCPKMETLDRLAIDPKHEFELI